MNKSHLTVVDYLNCAIMSVESSYDSDDLKSAIKDVSAALEMLSEKLNNPNSEVRINPREIENES
jgi:hypothetical protein